MLSIQVLHDIHIFHILINIYFNCAYQELVVQKSKSAISKVLYWAVPEKIHTLMKCLLMITVSQ